MSLTRLVWPEPALHLGEHVLPVDVSRHARATRVTAGQPVEILDLAGTVWHGVLLGWDGARARVHLVACTRERGEPPGPLVVGLGVLHTQAFDWAVEKLTELGATCIVPVVCERVQGRHHGGRRARWQRVADAALAQCGRSRAPRVELPASLESFVRSAKGVCLVATPEAGPPPHLTEVSALTVLIGPEGGFTARELAAACAAGFLPLGLGPRTLRAETAAVAAVAVACSLTGWLWEKERIGATPPPESGPEGRV